MIPNDPRRPEAYSDQQQYPTPQTTRNRTVSRSDRFWWYVYNDPRGLLLLISAVIGTIYVIIKIVDGASYYASVSNLMATLPIEQQMQHSVFRTFLAGIPTVHYLSVIAAFAFNWVVFFTRRPWAALVSFVLYFVAAVAYIRWALFLLPCIILLLIGYMALVRRQGSWI